MTVRQNLHHICSHSSQCHAKAKCVDEFHRTNTNRTVVTTIETKYLGPTSLKGSRYSATDLSNGNRAQVSASYDLTSRENHIAAAVALLSKHAQGETYELLAVDDCRSGRGYLLTFLWV